jgi:hypothetical protein
MVSKICWQTLPTSLANCLFVYLCLRGLAPSSRVCPKFSNNLTPTGLINNITFATTVSPVLAALDVGTLPINAFIWSVALGSSLGGNLSAHAAIGNLLLLEIAQHQADLKVSPRSCLLICGRSVNGMF